MKKSELRKIIREELLSEKEYNKDMIKLSTDIDKIAKHIEKAEVFIKKAKRFKDSKGLLGLDNDYARKMFSLGNETPLGFSDVESSLSLLRFYLESVSVYWKEVGSGVNPNDINKSKFTGR